MAKSTGIYARRLSRLIVERKLTPSEDEEFKLNPLSFLTSTLQKYGKDVYSMARAIKPRFDQPLGEILGHLWSVFNVRGLRQDHIFSLLLSGKSQEKIASEVGVHGTTITSYELLLLARLMNLKDADGKPVAGIANVHRYNLSELRENAREKPIHEPSLREIASMIHDFQTAESLGKLGLTGITEENKLPRLQELLRQFFDRHAVSRPSEKELNLYLQLLDSKNLEITKAVGLPLRNIVLQYNALLIAKLAKLEQPGHANIDSPTKAAEAGTKYIKTKASEKGIDPSALKELAGTLSEYSGRERDELWRRLLGHFINQTKSTKLPKQVLDELKRMQPK